ncbi:MAG: glycosyltransferase family 4 protein [Stappiaceae bacterium]
MNICLVISGLPAGGAERIVTSLANYLVEEGKSVTLITFDSGKPYYPLDERINLRQLDIPSQGRPLHRAVLSSVKRVSHLRRTIGGSQPDIVISFLVKTNILTVLATRGMDIPVVVSERNNPDHQVLRPLWEFFRKRTYDRSTKIVTPSQGVLDWFPQRIKDKGLVIPNPVDLPDEIVPRQPGPPGLIAVGRLDQQKGFDLLLEAYSRVEGDFPDWSLVIRGEGRLRSKLEALRDSLGLKDRVSFPGITSEPGTWVREGEVFVLSSRFESFGNVLTEAMVAGLPIVSFNCPFGPGDIITDGEDGILLPPEDVDELASTLSRVMSDEGLRQKLGQAAQKNVRRFERRKIMKRWDTLIEELLHPAGKN